MNYRLLNNTGKKISAMGFGCMSLQPEAAAANIRLIHKALDAGINYFDTADIYYDGINEIQVGKALQHNRTKAFIATKTGNEKKQNGDGYKWNPHKTYILKTVENSLRRLQTDYIDLYQLHGGTIDDPIDETIEAFELLQQQGKILHYGISSIRPNVIKEYIKHSKIVSVMMQYNLLDRRPEEEMLALLAKNNISVLARGPLAQGLLINKPAKEYLNHSVEDVAAAQALINGIATQQHTATAIAVGYVLHHAAVTSAVIGIRTEEQLDGLLNLNTDMYEAMYESLKKSVFAGVYEQHR